MQLVSRSRVAVVSQDDPDQITEQPERLASQQRRQAQEINDQGDDMNIAPVCVSSNFNPAIKPSSAVPAASPLKVWNCRNSSAIGRRR